MNKQLFIIFIAILLTSASVEAKRVTLPRNRIDGRSVLTQSMFNKNADEFVVKYNYDLLGDTIRIPNGATLLFKGSGKVAHGTIMGQESSIKASPKNALFDDITITGGWKVDDIYSSWFEFGKDANVNTHNLQNMCALTGDEYPGVLHILEGEYLVEANDENISCIKPNSNTNIILDGNLLLQPNALRTYNIIDISKKHNVSIYGSGSLVGDVENHMGNEGEWGMGINITSSKDVTVQGITIKNCWGDCIYIGQFQISKDEYSENVRIEDVTCEAGRRQGLSLIAGKNIHIKKSQFIDTGKIKYTAPGRGIDIEPNDKENTIVHNILIEDCNFAGNYDNNDLLTYNLNPNASVKVLRCKMDGRVSLYQNSYNVVIDSCEIRSLDFVASDISDNIIKNTVFKSVKPNIFEPQKVKFEDCKYPTQETSSLLFSVSTLLFTGLFLAKRSLRL